MVNVTLMIGKNILQTRRFKPGPRRTGPGGKAEWNLHCIKPECCAPARAARMPCGHDHDGIGISELGFLFTHSQAASAPRAREAGLTSLSR